MTRDQIMHTIKTDGMKILLDSYGYKPNRGGYIPCPFHGQRTGSLKIYAPGKGWACFGCHRGGSAIDFMMLHDNIDFKDAYERFKGLLGIQQQKHTNERENAQKRKLDTLYDAWMKQLKDRNQTGQFLLSTRSDLYGIAVAKPMHLRTAQDWDTILYEQAQLPAQQATLNEYKKLQHTGKADWIRAYSNGQKWAVGFDFYYEPWMT